nr:MAG TPA: hypothetical protein [Caudoviricetes sp.]
MERVTLEEAIKHEKEVTERNYRNTEYESTDSIDDDIKTIHRERAKEHEQLANWLEELKSYKEAEEQGLLVRLPCKVRDIVWELCLCDDGNYKIFPMIVKTISEYGTLRQVKKDITIWNIYAESDYTYMYKSFADFGKTVFSTKEEAEKKLEEVKNGL